MGDVAVGARTGSEDPEGERPDAAHGTASPPPPVPEEGSDGRVSPPADGAGRRPARKNKQRSFWKELPILLGVALVLALLIKTFLLQAFSIPSDSMQNTLQRGDRVLVDKFTPWFGAEPKRGEVVVFEDPGGWLPEMQVEENPVQKVLSFVGLMPSANEKDLIKRVIAVGGDTVECTKGGPVKVNGKALDETSYLFPGNSPCDDNAFKPVKVPDGKLWVMGDHRQNSLDSRYHQDQPSDGFVPVDNVVGRAVVVAWPINRWSTLPVPGTYDQQGLAAGAAAVAPAGLGLMAAVPLVLWRRRQK
ncbi:signal peptidase I [Streptomyces sp. AJS327]|uniref:signal peptidase I n=1 Tax=Streptomyces sp. AJS327 TaxID=2545265 RepID=UPI0015DDA156|nr:signal peptidase I [Streptomyces sp. AJS327]MBA0051818.1 signal peptidase I [Streptomyces sp. AJS327]